MIRSVNTKPQEQSKKLIQVRGKNSQLPIQKQRKLHGGILQNVPQNLIQKKEQVFLSEFGNQMGKLYGTAKSMDTIKTDERWLSDEKVKKSVVALMDQYNETLDFFAQHPDNHAVNGLRDALLTVGESLEESLAYVGITVGDDHKMSGDMQKFDVALMAHQGVVKALLYAVVQGVKSTAQKGMATSAGTLLAVRESIYQPLLHSIDFQA